MSRSGAESKDLLKVTRIFLVETLSNQLQFREPHIVIAYW